MRDSICSSASSQSCVWLRYHGAAPRHRFIAEQVPELDFLALTFTRSEDDVLVSPRLDSAIDLQQGRIPA